MKRSEINDIMAEADDFIRSFGFVLPPFAYWTPDEMKARRGQIDAIVAGRMGWDITDYGQGDFEKLGLFLFTLRNGRLSDLQKGGGMCYAEKLLISKQDQISPMHRHYLKAEDIINRGGATLAIELFGSAEDGSFDGAAGGTVACDGIARNFAPGEVLMLAPGESVTLMPGRLARLLGRGGRRADRRGVDGERRRDRQLVPGAHRALRRDRGRRGADASPGVGLRQVAQLRARQPISRRKTPSGQSTASASA
jgi:D-lyxose ketol-isomerase